MVRFWSARRLVKVITSCAMTESSPEVGSSRKISEGMFMISTAMLSRFSCPPEMPRMPASPTMLTRHVCSPSRSATAFIRARRSASVYSRSLRRRRAAK